MSYRLKATAVATAVAITTFMAPAAMAADAKAGKKVFRQCRACHVVDAETNRVGPHLNGVVGRTAGMVEGFRYSDAMKGAGEGGLVWTEENIAAYLMDPKGFVKGNRMAFRGLRKAEDATNVIAYIKEAGG